MNKSYKKAISPLIATVLIIVVCLSVITIIMTWSVHFSKSNLETVDESIDEVCSNAGTGIIVQSCEFNIEEDTLKIKTKNLSNTFTYLENDLNYSLYIESRPDLRETNIITHDEINPGITNIFTISSELSVKSTSSIVLSVYSKRCPSLTYTYNNCEIVGEDEEIQFPRE